MKNSDSAAYYHVCTDGNALAWMFKDTEDFIAGVNRIGICAFETCIQIIAFILMDNHVHFVLYGTLPKCKEFITRYKTLTGKWISSKYQLKEYLKHLPSEFILIESEEQLLDTIAYIDRNSIVAGGRYLPSEYPWGSARYMFRQERDSGVQWISLGNLRLREYRNLLKTRYELPQDWRIDARGMIDPQSFTDVVKANSIFKSPVRYIYFLSRKLEGKIDVDAVHGSRTFIPDKELRPIVAKMVMEMFQMEDVRSLNVTDRLSLARRLRREYVSTVKQISRMLSLDPELLKGFV